MSFQPVLPFTGYPGWTFLSRTLEQQQDTFEQGAQITRQVKNFEENIGAIQTAEQLVNDRQLLEVALGAFGLEEDINSKAFIQQVLESDTLDTSSLANRLADKRYLEFAQAFGFGDFDVPRTQLSDFPTEITTAYQNSRFEIAVGDQNADMRLALGADRDLQELSDRSISDTAKWYSVMGNAPLRQVFDTAFGMPASFAALDLDKQLEIYRDRAVRDFGADSIEQFSQPDIREKLIRNFLIRSEAQSFNAQTSASQTALTLLQSA